MKLAGQRLIAASIIGGLIGTLPQIVAAIPVVSYHIGEWQKIINYLLIPGVLVGLLLTGWNGHDVNFAVVLIGSGVFYASCAYGLLCLFAKVFASDVGGPDAKNQFQQKP